MCLSHSTGITRSNANHTKAPFIAVKLVELSTCWHAVWEKVIPLGIVYVNTKKLLMGQSKSGEIHLRNSQSNLAPIWAKNALACRRTCRNNLYFSPFLLSIDSHKRTASGDILSDRQMRMRFVYFAFSRLAAPVASTWIAISTLWLPVNWKAFVIKKCGTRTFASENGTSRAEDGVFLFTNRKKRVSRSYNKQYGVFELNFPPFTAHQIPCSVLLISF